jgi:tRNA C32,U32 (ribose-2'-O)-methylase TrmJ
MTPNETEETRSLPQVPERDALDSRTHALSALDAARVADVLTRWRDDALRGAATTVQKHNALDTGRLPASAEAQFTDRVSRAEVFGKLADQFRVVSQEHRT